MTQGILRRMLAVGVPAVLVATSAAQAAPTSDRRLGADAATTSGYAVRVGLRVGRQDPAASKARISVSIRDSSDRLVGRLIAFSGRSDARVHVRLHDRARRVLKRRGGRLPVTISATVRGHVVSPIRVTLRAP